MREILFRGKRLDNGEWVEGFYCKHDTVKVCFTTDNPETKHLIVMDGFCDWGFEPPLQGVEVDPATVGQFTGLLGKNGKRIFEGDIVKLFFIDTEEVGEIVWDEERCRVAYMSPDVEIYGVDGTVEIEIIGNIHDDTELLRGG